MKLTIYQLTRLTQIYIPTVQKALEEKEISCEMFCIQWFITIFSHDFDRPWINVIWDLFLQRRWKFVFQVSLALLRAMSDKVLSLDPSSLMHFMKNAIRDKSLGPEVSL